ncbi:hypothetical protein [Kitasatospora paranensis]|uniref:ABC transporter ATP-binding protein n=1 Tax=Kitasatospora paranensis TaxID=258053 RepID=A0ABW2FXY0_9ACTN
MSGLSITALHASHGSSEVLSGIDLTVENGAPRTAPPGGDGPLFVEARGTVHPVTEA